MDLPSVMSLVVGVVSLVLAGLAIWLSSQAERRSTASYDRTKDLLAEIGEKAAVIERSVSETQSKLVDTVTSIAKPKEETQDDMMTRVFLENAMKTPELLGQFMKMSEQFSGQSSRQGKKST